MSGESGILRCDGFGCDEAHPIDHEALGEPSFGTGRWLGWLYVDLNRPDLVDRVMRFCSTFCLRHWLDLREMAVRGAKPLTALDEALRRPRDEVARQRAGLKGGTP